jgi:SAM-dependent methyltransferase
MSRTSEEYERLRRQSELLESITGSVLESLEQIQSDRFDLVFARLLLQHLDDPVMTLRKMYGQVRPGGRIVVQDYYFPAMDSHPALEPLAEFKKVFFGVYEKEGRETRMGIKLPGLFIEAGIGSPDSLCA